MAMLDGLGILEELSDEEKAQLEVFCQEKMLQPGEVLFNEGDEANAMYFLKFGEIDVLTKVSGSPVKLGTIEAEDILGEMALFGTSGKRMATAIARKETVLITILSFSIKELTNNHPQVLEKIKGIIEQRMYENKTKKRNIQ